MMGMTHDEGILLASRAVSDFVIRVSFVIRHSDFLIRPANCRSGN